MNLAVFGASGRTGIPLVTQALAAGHHVTALVRNPAKFTIRHDCLRTIQGDVLDAAKVAETIKGAEVVISVIGHVKGSPADMQTVATRHMIAAMNTYGVRRIITLTGGGVRDPHDQPTVMDRGIRLLLKLLAGKVLEDGVRHTELVRQSGLMWTVVRGPVLTEGPRTNAYRVGYVGTAGRPQVSREDVADFILKQVTSAEYVNKAPMLGS